jgi:hypothetical protein
LAHDGQTAHPIDLIEHTKQHTEVHHTTLKAHDGALALRAALPQTHTRHGVAQEPPR